MRTLIVDDSVTTRKILKRLLLSLGHEVAAEAASVTEALECLRADNDVDLVLSDLRMPGRDGLELIRALKIDAVLSNLPVLVISSDSDPERVCRAMQAGAVGYITKPFRKATIERRVQEAIALTELAAREEAEPPVVDGEAGERPGSRLSGSLRDLSLLELLQFLAGLKKSGDLRLETPHVTGVIRLQAGEVTGARVVPLDGSPEDAEAALLTMAHETRGRFALEPPEWNVPPASAIDRPTLPLIFDLARQRDEVERQGEHSPGYPTN